MENNETTCISNFYCVNVLFHIMIVQAPLYQIKFLYSIDLLKMQNYIKIFCAKHFLCKNLSVHWKTIHMENNSIVANMKGKCSLTHPEIASLTQTLLGCHQFS